MKSKSEFNEEPVYYCSRCLSLGIKTVTIENSTYDFCDKCGCTDIKEAMIEEWEKIYNNRYNTNFIKK